MAGLADRLVPFTATAMNLCKYQPDHDGAHLVDGSQLGTEAMVAWLEGVTNRSRPLRAGAAPLCVPSNAPFFLASFSRGSLHVDVLDKGGCGYVTNGVLVAQPTTQWRVLMETLAVGIEGGSAQPNT